MTGRTTRQTAATRPGDWRLRLQFHGLLALFAAPFALGYLAHRLWLRRRPVAGLAEKLSGRVDSVTDRPLLVHGVSLGEVNLMRPLVPHLERTLGVSCLLTTTTTTGWEALQREFPRYRHAFLPVDLPAPVRTFLGRIRPRALILLELEIWPTLLAECHARRIPVVLINARVGAASFRGYRLVRPMLQPLLRDMRLVLAQNALWAARLLALGVPRGRLVTAGSLKADMVQPAEPVSAGRWGAEVGLVPERPLLLLASTSGGTRGRSDEEAAILGDRLVRWRERGWQVVICPRHPERGGEIAQLVARLGGAPRRTASGERLDREDGVLIVDETGRLNHLYACCARSEGIAIVGGSFGSGRKGQNMLEAAAAGCCTVVGPDTANFPDAMALLREAGAVVELGLPVEQAHLVELAEDADRRRRLGLAGRTAWLSARGALARTVIRTAEALTLP